MQPGHVARVLLRSPTAASTASIRSRGVIAIHHGDAYLADIVEDMAEIGVQCWQGVLPENNIPELQQSARTAAWRSWAA